MDDSLQQLLQRLPSSGAKRLEYYLGQSERGYDLDLRTPLFNKAPREEIIEALDQAMGTTGFEDFDEINEDEKAKIGPMSIRLPSAQRRADWEAYEEQSFNPEEHALEMAIRDESSLIPERSLRPLQAQQAYKASPRGKKLRGLPWMTTDDSKDSWYIEQAFAVRSPEEMDPFVLGWRGQARGLNEVPKQRVVAMATKVETFMASSLLYPLLNVLRLLPGFSAWLGDVYVDKAITRLLSNAGGRRVHSMDYSGFDASISRELLDIVASLQKRWFIPEVSARIDLLSEYGATAGLVVPWEIAWENRNGAVPSGKVFTNMDDNMINRIACRYVGYRYGTSVRDMETLGDDSVVVYEDDLDPAAIEAGMKELGLVCNSDKQFVSTDACHYLQRWHSLRYQKDGLCVGIRPPNRALSGILSFEHFHDDWSEWMVTARLIMQVENVKHHPDFETFVLFMKKGDRILSSGTDAEYVFKRAGGAEHVRDALDLRSFPFNVQDPDRVGEFETTRILREHSRD